MSRIGKAQIKLPAGVDFKINSNNLVSIKGPKGELHQQIMDLRLISIEI